MNFSAIFVLVMIIVLIVVLAMDKMRPGLTFLSIVVVFMAAGIISPQEAIAGFSNKGMITVAVLFLISEGIRQSGALNKLISKMLPNKRTSIPVALLRMLPSVAGISAFLNNTAVVVIFAPIIKRWADMVNMPSTKFLIPLSYATILGGVCTLIGTSTNLVVHGMMLDNGFTGFGMFELGKVGVIIAVVGITYIIIFGNMLLPGNKIMTRTTEKIFKEYYYDVTVNTNSGFIGSLVKNGKINLLQQMEVIVMKRKDGSDVTIKGQRVEIQPGDRFTLAGKSGAISRLLNTDGLTLTALKGADQGFVKKAIKQVETVLGPRFPGINNTLGEFDFFRHYGAVVMAIHRNGERISDGLDNVVLREGDNLVLLTDGTFVSTWGASSVFYMVSEVGDFDAPKDKKKRWFAASLCILMVVGATIGDYLPAQEGLKLDMFFFAMIVMVVMAWTKIFPAKQYTKYISWDILIAIASAFAISKAMQNSGIADIIAETIIGLSHNFGAHGILALLFIITNIFTEIITNNAAAALSFPIALSVSQQLGVDPYPFFVVICIAASTSFSTPIGYQTNLIVQSIGGYKFRDFIKIGLPLNIISFVISVVFIPLIWGF